jgi:hypothetical protein
MRGVPKIDILLPKQLGRMAFALVTPEGRVPMKLIGRGNFSQIFLDEENPGRVIALTAAPAYDKLSMAMAHVVAPGNPHLPAVQLLGHIESLDRFVFTMPPYMVGREAVGALAPEQLDELVRLQRCVRAAAVPLPEFIECVEKAHDRGQVSNEMLAAARAIERGVKRMEVPPEYKAMIEVPERNIAADFDRQIVLLDILYFAAEL